MKYIPTIGIETHVQLKTKTKLFSGVSNDARGAPPNSLISHIDAGMPGALPVLNQEAVNICVRAALALGTKPQMFSKFERKHYFYPDLPKGYQITQYEDPIIKGGFVNVVVDGRTKRINIERANLEEDAGKNIHPSGADYSLVDLNRAGTPLLEIVSRPDIKNPQEAKAFARELYLLMKYAGVTDGDLYHGHMRFDINISVSRDDTKLGTRSEVKNLNSFRSVEAAAEYEINRQVELLDKGQKVAQETRGWDESKQKTVSQRAKEEAEDYRYMPEPDIPPIELDEKFSSAIAKSMPILPGDIRRILSGLGIQAKIIEDILDKPNIVAVILQIQSAEHAKRALFWLLQAESVGSDSIETHSVIELSQMVADNKLNSTSAKAVFSEMIKSSDKPAEIARRLNLLQLSDESELEKIIAQVIKENPSAVRDIKSGQVKAISFLLGRVMARSEGQANPEIAQKLIKKQLEV